MRRRAISFSPGTATNVSFGAALLVLSFVALTLYGATRQAHEAARWVSHTEEVLQAIGGVRETFARAEAAQRAFLLTGADRFLQEREEWAGQLQQGAATVGMLTADNPAQQERIEAMTEAIRRRLALAAQTSRERQAGGAPTPVQLDAGQEVSDRFYALAGAMQQEERRLLGQRQAIELQRQRITSWVIGGSFGVFLVVLVPAYLGVRHQLRRRQRLERQMTELVEQFPATVWQLRTQPGKPAEYLYVGRHALRDRGFTPEQLRRDASLVFTNVVEEDREKLQRATAASEQAGDDFHCEYRIALADGTVRWIRTAAALRRRPDGTVYWTGYWVDVTAQKELQEALQSATDEANRANRAKSTFLATMSHEIRTPMNGVLGLLELLNLSRLDSEQRATLNVVSESGRALLRIIDDILDFSKVEAGRLALDPEPASVPQLVNRACQIHSGIASSRGLLLQHSVDPRISPVLVFDPLRLGQILNNFISNALKFTTEGSVTVTVESLSRADGKEHLRFTVADTGVGIAREAAAQLFEPFSQADARTASRYGGTGLGLAICKRLAVLMDGSVSLSSEEGVGTRVVLEVAFPIGSAEELLQAAEREEAPRQLTQKVATRRLAPGVAEAEAEGRLVLVVDDHPTNRLVLSRQVAALGYGLLMAEDGAQALALWQERRIGLVLTDCNMPELNGYDLAREIRARELQEGRARTPIVACTANALDNEGARCLAAGMDDIVIKPVNLVDLMARLDQWLPLPAGLEPPSAPANSAVIETAVLEGITGGDGAVLREVLLDFRQVNEADLKVLRAGMPRADPEQVLHLAHRIQGAARTVGAQRLARACERFAQAVRTGVDTAVQEEFSRLEQEVAALNAHIDGLTTSRAGAHAA